MIESLFNFIPGGSEWIIVIVAAGVLLFGAKKIPELAKTFGKAKGEYKKGEIEADKELKDIKDKLLKLDSVALCRPAHISSDKKSHFERANK